MLTVGSSWGLTSRRDGERGIGEVNLDEHMSVQISLSKDEIVFRRIDALVGDHTLVAVNLESLVCALQDAKHVEITRLPYRV